MKQVRSYADFFRSCESLISACNENPETLAGVESLKEDLKTLLSEARTLKDEQNHLTGLRKATTQRLGTTMDDAKEAVRKLRSFVTTRMHSRNEQLTRFGILPNRSRPRKRRPAEEIEAATAPKASTEPVE